MRTRAIVARVAEVDVLREARRPVRDGGDAPPHPDELDPGRVQRREQAGDGWLGGAGAAGEFMYTYNPNGDKPMRFVSPGECAMNRCSAMAPGVSTN